MRSITYDVTVRTLSFSCAGRPAALSVESQLPGLRMRRASVRARAMQSLAFCFAFCCAFCCAFGFSIRIASAQSPAANGTNASGNSATTARARSAWDQGDFDIAASLYKESINAGGLGRDDLIEAYSRLGTARMILKQPKDALAAFRQAAMLDLSFKVPSDGGKKANQVAEQARRERKRLGLFTVGVDAPPRSKPGQSFIVTATIDSAHSAFVQKIAVVVRDPMTGQSFTRTENGSAGASFEVPLALTLPDAALSVRVDALDSHNNQLATNETRVRIDSTPQPETPVAAGPGNVPSSTQGQGPRTERVAVRVQTTPKEIGADEKSRGGFFSTAWPYVIGGVLLAAGGAALYYGLTQSDTVTVGAARVR